MPAAPPGQEGSLTELDNGLRVVTEAMAGARSVSLGAWIGVGARDEPVELAGVSHFLEHLLFKGTPRRSARELAEAVDAVGGEMNAFTAKEHTAYYLRLPEAALDLGLDVLGDVLTEPSLAPDDVDAERHVILEELLLSEDEADERVQTLCQESLFPGHPLGREVLGSSDSVSALGRDEIAGFFQRWYRPANVVVAAAGRLDHARVVDAVGRWWDGGDRGVSPVRVVPEPKVEPAAVLTRPTEQAHVALGWRAPHATQPERYPLAVLNQVLGAGMSSRLFQEIRERRGLAYSVYSYSSLFVDAGMLVAYAGSAPSRLGEVRTLIEAEIQRLQATGITDRELSVAKGYVEGSLLLSLEDSASRMVRLGGSMLTHGRVPPVDEQLDRLRGVTADEVGEVIASVFGRQQALAAVGPIRDEVLTTAG